MSAASAGGDAAGREIHDGKTVILPDRPHEIERRAKSFGFLTELILAQGTNMRNPLIHFPHMVHGLNDVAGTRFALGSDHGGSLCYAAQSLSDIPGTADERHPEFGLVDMIHVIRGRKHFAFIDIVNLNGLEELRLDKVSDAALGHDRNRDSFLDAADHGGIRHARDTARGADIRGNSFQRHDGTGSGVLSDLRLLGGCNVHDNAALEHLGKLAVQCRAVFLFFCHMSVLPVDFFCGGHSTSF